MAERRKQGDRSNSEGSDRDPWIPADFPTGSKSSRPRSRSQSSKSSRPRPKKSSGSKSSGSKSSGARSRSQGSKSSGSKSSSSRSGGSSSGSEPVRGTAPSAADITKLEKFEASEEAKQHEPSTKDAMGHDKRRQVVGHSYGPTRRTQIMFFIAVGVVLVVVVGGWLSLVALFDKPPTNFADKAPWSTTVTNAELAAQQSAKPRAPIDPCGEPGNEYPIPPESPCAPPNKANDFQGTSGK